MEPLGNAIARLRPRFQVQSNDASPAPEPEPEPSCPICKDHGFVRKDVDLGHPDFGRAFPCTCRAGEMRDRLRRRSNLGHLTGKTFEEFHPEGRDGPIDGLYEAFEKSRVMATAPA